MQTWKANQIYLLLPRLMLMLALRICNGRSNKSRVSNSTNRRTLWGLKSCGLHP